MRLAIAQSAHEIPARAPIRVEVGERVQVGRRDDQWPAFVFVSTERGSGWVPERHLDRERPSALVVEAYDTTELPTSAGERLEVLVEDRLSGWAWCRAKTGREGWVPDRILSPVQ